MRLARATFVPAAFSHLRVHLTPPSPVTEGFRCGVCDFDCCLECFTRRDLRGAEGGLRTDRGLLSASAAGGSTAPTAFFLRALSLVKSEAPLFVTAFACLIATTAATARVR